jgi:hypothetical protein
MPKTAKSTTKLKASPKNKSKPALQPKEIAFKLAQGEAERQFEIDPEARYISSVRDIVNAFGGPKAMARWTGDCLERVVAWLVERTAGICGFAFI